MSNPELRIFGLSMLTAAAIFAFVGVAVWTAVWAIFAEPWYERTLIDQMRATSPMGRDETRHVASFFPVGMSGEAAFEMLHKNGFSCSPPITAPVGATIVSCVRDVWGLACVASYNITILFDNSAARNVAATANLDCS